MRAANRLYLLFGACALGLSGCASNERQPRPAKVTKPRVRPAVPDSLRAPSSRAYVEAAAAIDLFEIRASELALRRSTSQRQRDFARMMIRAHKGMSAQLSFAGRRLNLLPAADLSPKYRTMLANLAASSAFDALYRRQQIAVHGDALRLHTSYAKDGDSPTLRPVAKAAAPIVRRHLQLLGSM